MTHPGDRSSPNGPASRSNDPDGRSTDLPSMVSKAGVCVVELAPDGEVVAANDAFADLVGAAEPSFVGRPITDVLVAVPPPLSAILTGGPSDDSPVTVTLSVETDDEAVACEGHFDSVSTEAGRAVVGVIYRREGTPSQPEPTRDVEPTADEGSISAKAFVSLAESISDGIIVLDAASAIQYANPAVERILGYAPEELVGESKLSIIPERLRSTHLHALNRYLETGEKNIDWEYVELPGKHTAGHEVPLGISLNDFFFEGDRYFVGLFRDVTARKRAQRRLSEREERLNRYKEYTDDVLDAIDDMFYVVDAEGSLKRWNRTLREVSGYSDAEIDSMHALEFFEADHRDRIASAIEEGFETGSARVEGNLSTKGGDSIPYEFVASALTDPKGKPVLAGIGRDVTSRRERRRRIEESERRYRTLVEHFPNGLVALFDEQLRYTAVGGELLDGLGIDRDDAIGSVVGAVAPSAVDAEIELHFRAALDGETQSFDVDYDGRRLAAYTLPIEDASGSVDGGMVMLRDVTERAEIQRQLAASNERLEQFAYAASHDLQEPLRMVTSYLTLVDQRYGDRLDEDGEEFLEFAIDGADRMRNMIDGLLQYSRVDTQGDPFEPVDLNDVLDDVREDLQLRIEEEDATITVADLPPVSGDEGQLRQVFQNLASNAIEYRGDEAPRIRVTGERDGSVCRIAVEDNGIGIDPDDADEIFDVFHRLHSHGERAGTGIGLALCRRIVDRHDGDIRVESDPGEGSTFVVTLPAADGD